MDKSFFSKTVLIDYLVVSIIIIIIILYPAAVSLLYI